MTITQLGIILGVIAGIITSVGVIIAPIKKNLTKTISDSIKKEIEPISREVNTINENIKALDVGQCKNYLVRFLADVEQGNKIDEVEKQRAYELYDHYTNDLKQNSYIHKRWEELMK